MSYETGSYQKVYYDFIYFLYSLNCVLSFPNSYPIVKEHLQGAVSENIFLFTSIDTDPRNGQASWKEYLAWFLKKIGNNDSHYYVMFLPIISYVRKEKFSQIIDFN